jgi:phage terminase large subunit-like protein
MVEFEGEAVPFELMPEQAFIVGSIFGWQRRDGDRWVRRFTSAYCEGGKGSGKTPLAAGIGLYMMLADSEMSAQVYAAGSKRDQAMILFSDAVAMAQRSPQIKGAALSSFRARTRSGK